MAWCGSVYHWWCCDMVDTSDFMDDVMFSYNSPIEACHCRSSDTAERFAYRLTPLLCGTGCMLSQMKIGVKTIDKPCVKGCRERSLRCTTAWF